MTLDLTQLSNDLDRVIDRFSDLRVLVVGDAMLDTYLEGAAERLCREAPVPVVRLADRCDLPGGAANAARNLCALGADVTLLSVVGDDAEGDRLADALAVQGLDTAHLVRARGRRTLTLNRVVASSQILVRFDHGSTGAIPPAAEEVLLARIAALAPAVDAILISDYSYGVVGDGVLALLADLQARAPRILVADSRHVAAFRHIGVTAVKPNWSETLQLLVDDGLDGAVQQRAERIAAHGEQILDMTGAQIAAVTLDTEGAIVFERGRPPHRTYAVPHAHSEATGAGDTFVSALTLALAAGAHTPAAAELASAAAAVVVDKERTAVCSTDELRERVLPDNKIVPSLQRLVNAVAARREHGQRVVFTNGCFDLLHRGHIGYLNAAKMHGDVLVVGVNDDDSVRRLKGPERPINTVEDRMRVLAALSCVDYLIPFSGDTPIDVIEAVRPDVYAKGGDYTEATLREAPVVTALGGRVEILDYEVNVSTTGILERVRRAQVSAAAKSS